MARGKLFSKFRFIGTCALRDGNCSGEVIAFKSKFNGEIASLCEAHFKETRELQESLPELDKGDASKKFESLHRRVHEEDEAEILNEIFERNPQLNNYINAIAQQKLDELNQRSKNIRAECESAPIPEILTTFQPSNNIPNQK